MPGESGADETAAPDGSDETRVPGLPGAGVGAVPDLPGAGAGAVPDPPGAGVTAVPDGSGPLWYDDEAGPMVRPYTVTRGRTLAGGGATQMDVIAVVSVSGDPDSGGPGAEPPPPGGPAGVRQPASGSVAQHARPGPTEGRPRPDALGEEHLTLLEHCAPGPLSVADLAAEADLPLGVVRVLLADLLALGRIRITRPVAPDELPDIGLLQHLIIGLRSL